MLRCLHVLHVLHILFFPSSLPQIVCKDNFKYEVSSPDEPGAMLALEEPTGCWRRRNRQEEPRKASCSPGENFINVDRLFLLLSPFLFVMFNCVYWYSYAGQKMLWSLQSPVEV
jgi:hypothetical protein